MDTNDKNIIELDKKSTTPQAYDLIMSAEEKKLFIETVKNPSVRNYLEFGSGGSTFTTLLNSQANVFSVESNLDFIDHLRTWDYIKESEKNKRLIFEHINIGKVGDWGMPLEKEKIELFPNYSELIFKKHNIRFDCILIDGRFRIACTLNSKLMFSIAVNAKADIFLMDEFFGGVGDNNFKAKTDKLFSDRFLTDKTIVIVVIARKQSGNIATVQCYSTKEK